MVAGHFGFAAGGEVGGRAVASAYSASALLLASGLITLALDVFGY
jgi:hypothetical protein